MQKNPTGMLLSASDVANHLGCTHLTQLNLRVAHGLLKAPHFRSPLLDVLRARGLEHEKRYVEHLRGSGRTLVDLSGKRGDDAVTGTKAAMASGAGAIIQGALTHGVWVGYPDVLLRVETPSSQWAWSYEVADTKLAAETKAGTILQLSLYSKMLEQAQGTRPRFFYVVTPERFEVPEQYPVSHYAAITASICSDLLKTVEQAVAPFPPLPVADTTDHCDVCRWSPHCNRERREADHLSLVAGIGRQHRNELWSRGVNTVAQFAAEPLPLSWKPTRGSRETVERLREQARVQVQSRGKSVPVFEMLAPEPEQGLARLPEPNPGDVFLDLEGDPFIGDEGREYLFGWAEADQQGWKYTGRWAYTAADEKAAFEEFMDHLTKVRAQHPGMHVYHYAPYEPAALKRLAGRYATRGDALDDLLRGAVFVDLYAVVRQSMRVGVERYSIKTLEPVFGYQRQVPLEEASEAKAGIEHLLELGGGAQLPTAEKDKVEGYNKDDCISTAYLRKWLEELRVSANQAGATIERPPPPEPNEPNETTTAARAAAEAMRLRLHDGLSPTGEGLNPEQRARWILGHLLQFHQRESKVVWWNYFRLREMSDEDLMDEPDAVAGLQWVGVERPTGRKRSSVHRFTFPPQDTQIRVDAKLHAPSIPNGGAGTCAAIDPVAGTLGIKTTAKLDEVRPSAVFAFEAFNDAILEAALLDVAGDVANRGVNTEGRYAAVRAILTRATPRLRGQSLAGNPGESVVDRACRVALALDGSCLPIQGPPGTGKTYLAAQLIVAAVKAGKKVGVSANGHAVIGHLLEACMDAAREQRVSLKPVQKPGAGDEPVPGAERVNDAAEAAELLSNGQANVVGGTAWLWCHDAMKGALDLLVIDEASQVPLANAVAMARSAKSVVVVGDPQQLSQPTQGAHPPGAGLSVLEHILDGRETLPDTQGLFLEQSRRLAPRIAAFTSEAFYDGRLTCIPGLENQQVRLAGELEGAGLWFQGVTHSGNRNRSTEEVDSVVALVARLLEGGVWTDQGRNQHRITPQDILVVAPYNAHVGLLAARVPAGVRVGTVDKFQGQEAPVVIYSMATSTPGDAPRGMEFLYSLNRLNVASSRAKCACVLVANPALLRPACRTPRQLRLANALAILDAAATKMAGHGGPLCHQA